MDFAQPNYLFCFLPLILIGLLIAFLTRRKEVAIAKLGTPDLIARLSVTVNHTGRRWQLVLWFVALSFEFVLQEEHTHQIPGRAGARGTTCTGRGRVRG